MEENVQFDDKQDVNAFEANKQSKVGATTRLFMKLGLAKDQKGANGVMAVFSIVCLLAMAYFILATYFPGILSFSKPKQATNNQQLPQEVIDAINRTKNNQ